MTRRSKQSTEVSQKGNKTCPGRRRDTDSHYMQPPYSLGLSHIKPIMEDTAAATLPYDIILDILLRVSTDSAALFRCAAASKQWRAFIADRAFLKRCWTENGGRPSSHLGFLIQQRRDEEDIDSPYPPLFVPPLESMLGARPRLLTDFLSCEPDGLLNGAQPLAARHGLVVVRLFRGVRGNAVHMAVCDLPAGTCNVLPELRLRCEASAAQV